MDAVALRAPGEPGAKMHVKRRVLFIQGGGAGVHDEWDHELVRSLARALGSGYAIRYPRMPHEDDPRYAAWKAKLEEEFAALDDRAVLVGHSIGGTILVNVLAERSTRQNFGAVFLIAAPFVGDGGWPSDELESPADLGGRLPHGVPVHVYHGLDDRTAPPSHAALYARAIPQARVHRLPGRDHQLNGDLGEVAQAIKALDGAA